MGPLSFDMVIAVAVGVNAIFTLILWAMVYTMKYPPKKEVGA